MIPLLFVYGTLRANAGHPMARWLGRRARPCGVAWFRGRLYDLGPYPGAIPSARQDDRVVGELYRLRRAADMKFLDRYEGPEYRRMRVVVKARGMPRQCWIYVYEGPARLRRVVASGDWLEGE